MATALARTDEAEFEIRRLRKMAIPIPTLRATTVAIDNVRTSAELSELTSA
jgi:hypothetical protein